MATRDISDLHEYSVKLRSYTTAELEDIYYHIDILQEPLRYNALMRELEARRLQPSEPPPRPQTPNLATWLAGHGVTARRPVLRACVLSALLFTIATGLTFAFLSPIWFFAMPLKFLGVQTAIVYFACAPLAPLMAAAITGKLGGRGVYGIAVLAGVAVGMLLFDKTGTPAAIIKSIMEAHDTGGPSFGAF